jgi:UDP-glucose/iron transport system permease protein
MPELLLAAEVIDPGWSGLALAALLMALLLAAAVASGVHLVRLGLVATARTTLQLLGVGYVLNWVFASHTWWTIVGVLTLMTVVAGRTGSRRVERALEGTGLLLTIVLAVVTAVTLLYVGRLVVGVSGPDPRYLIPLGGIILGNAMTAGSLAAQRFHDDLRDRRERIEAALALGASPAQATREPLRRAFQAALTPTLNAMLIVGIVKLPGVMTGQMLGGSAPLEAAKYQIVIMFTLAFGDGMTALAVLRLLRRRAFTEAWQPRL